MSENWVNKIQSKFRRRFLSQKLHYENKSVWVDSANESIWTGQHYRPNTNRVTKMAVIRLAYGLQSTATLLLQLVQAKQWKKLVTLQHTGSPLNKTRQSKLQRRGSTKVKNVPTTDHVMAPYCSFNTKWHAYKQELCCQSLLNCTHYWQLSKSKHIHLQIKTI